MLSRKEFYRGNEAKEALEVLRGKFKLPVGGTIEEVEALIDRAITALNIYSKANRFIINKTLYTDTQDETKFVSARLVIRPRVAYALGCSECRDVVDLPADDNFFENFIDTVAAWLDTYDYMAKLDANLKELSSIVNEIGNENGIPFNVYFTLGKELVDVSDNYVVVGISEEVVSTLDCLPVFDNIEVRVRTYKEKILEVLKECKAPYEIVKTKGVFVKDLQLYSRKSPAKLLRKFCTRKVEAVRVGVGYYDTDKVFALIRKEAVTEEDLAKLDVSNAVVIDTVKMSKAEQVKGLSKTVISYKISPFDKETGAFVDIPLTTFAK
ncbi:hypothetical protein D3C81_10640 [compost metagenome]